MSISQSSLTMILLIDVDKMIKFKGVEIWMYTDQELNNMAHFKFVFKLTVSNNSVVVIIFEK